MLRRGDYVLCNFPFRGVDGPGPSAHVVLCAATGREGNTPFAIVFYTTSQIAYEGSRRPRQYLFVDQNKARALNQRRAFHVDASRIARLPLTKVYFPGLIDDRIPAIGRDPGFVAKVEERLLELRAAGLAVSKVDRVREAR
jgi:hypothetical protein